MLSEIESGKNPLQSTLFRLSQRAEKLASLHTSCRPIADLLNSSLSSTREAGNDLQRELSSFDHSEEESERIEATLRRIDAIKRKYGSSTEEVLLAKTSMEEKLHLLLGRDNEIAQLEESLVTTKAACDSLAKELTSKRTETARRFGRIIECHLQSLNMPNALLNISVTPAPRSSTGDDHIQLVCSPNVGEKTIDVSEGASGGELARIYLAIQAVLADRFIIPTVLFDEIDASIGGMTANAVGDTLAAIGERRQVLSVTHFVQVASKAHSHFALTKEVRDGRTITLIQELTTKESKKREHQRMVGTHRS